DSDDARLIRRHRGSGDWSRDGLRLVCEAPILDIPQFNGIGRGYGQLGAIVGIIERAYRRSPGSRQRPGLTVVDGQMSISLVSWAAYVVPRGEATNARTLSSLRLVSMLRSRRPSSTLQRLS